MKVLLNSLYSGIRLTHAAEDLYAEKKGFKFYRYVQDKFGNGVFQPDEYDRSDKSPRYKRNVYCRNLLKDHGAKIIGDIPISDEWRSRKIKRHDPVLIEVCETLGLKESSIMGELKIIEIPAGTDYQVIYLGDDEAYSGEIVVEKGRFWGYGWEA